jgi:hypothetical protein
MDESDIQTVEEFTYRTSASTEDRGALKHNISCINNANEPPYSFNQCGEQPICQNELNQKLFNSNDRAICET